MKQSRAAYLLFYRRRTNRPIGGISRLKAEVSISFPLETQLNFFRRLLERHHLSRYHPKQALPPFQRLWTPLPPPLHQTAMSHLHTPLPPHRVLCSARPTIRITSSKTLARVTYATAMPVLASVIPLGVQALSCPVRRLASDILSGQGPILRQIPCLIWGTRQ